MTIDTCGHISRLRWHHHHYSNNQPTRFPHRWQWKCCLWVTQIKKYCLIDGRGEFSRSRRLYNNNCLALPSHPFTHLYPIHTFLPRRRKSITWMSVSPFDDRREMAFISAVYIHINLLLSESNLRIDINIKWPLIPFSVDSGLYQKLATTHSSNIVCWGLLRNYLSPCTIIVEVF